jgi:type II secretory pathway component PulF
MATASLNDFTALNEQLAALVEAGVPLDVGLPRRELAAADELERINATVVRRVNRGESLAEALEGDERDVPAGYRGLVQLGLSTGDLPSALEGSSCVAKSADDSRFAFETALVYPLIVCGFAYIGLIGFSLFLAPTLEEMYTSLNLSPGSGLRVLRAVRTTLPYWAVIPPIVLIVIGGWWLRAKARRDATGVVTGRLRWLPGTSRILFQERCARFAASLAALLDKQVPLADALSICGDTSGDAGLSAGAKAFADADKMGQIPGDDSAVAKQFPPFMRWAIWHADATTGRARALHIAAKLYRESSARRLDRLRAIAPLTALVLLGGTVTLLYGLTLFVPVVELLRALAVGVHDAG